MRASGIGGMPGEDFRDSFNIVLGEVGDMPFVPELPGHGLANVDLDEALREADLAAIVTAHPDVNYEQVVATAPLVVDFRGVTRGIKAENLVRL